MALEPGSLGKSQPATTLSTGFTYTPRSQLRGFELQADLLNAMEERLEQLQTYHRRPKDLDIDVL